MILAIILVCISSCFVSPLKKDISIVEKIMFKWMFLSGVVFLLLQNQASIFHQIKYSSQTVINN